MYGSTALTDMDKSCNDKFIMESYNSIVDNPFMYNVPDTTFIKVGNTDVLISVYSPNKKDNFKISCTKTGHFIAGPGKISWWKLPVDKYAFIIYLDKTRLFRG